MDSERLSYERVQGRVASPGELLQLVIHDPWFVWLRPLSELVVRMDELLAAEQPVGADELQAALDESRALLTPTELGPEAGGSVFGTQYHEALQRDPSVVLAHAEVARVLGDEER